MGKSVKKLVGGSDDSAKKDAAAAAERERQRVIVENQNKANIEAASTLANQKQVVEGGTDASTSLADDTYLARKRKKMGGQAENLGIV